MPWWSHPDWPELLGLLYEHADAVPSRLRADYDEWRFGLEGSAPWFSVPPNAWRIQALLWGFPAQAWDLRWRILLGLARK